MNAAHQKVAASHLSRDAYLYVRQSTQRQVFDHGESTRRQYALRERAVALGWPTERVVVIDSDLGLSGADSDREGFQHLVAEVGMGRAGIVLGLEVSRLARNSTDWHRLLEICALSETLILDEDGVYDPVDFNDRLLLGLKGTMSEAGAAYDAHPAAWRSAGQGQTRGVEGDAAGGAGLRPARPRGARPRQASAAQSSLGVRHLHPDRLGLRHGQAFQQREAAVSAPSSKRAAQGELHWKPLSFTRAVRILHNPRYAGAFAFGRSRCRRRPGGGTEKKLLAREEWTVLLRDAHPGYITWERLEENERQLRDNAQARGAERRSAPREGLALLQGWPLAACAAGT